MENWQEEHILANLPTLLKLTDCNTEVKSVLLAEKILGDVDVDILDTARRSHGRIEQSSILYKILIGREYAYEKFTKALFQCHQSGAVRIFIDGFLKEGIRNPLSLCNISIQHDGFETAQIIAYGQKCMIRDFFPNVKLADIQLQFQEILSEMEYFECFVQKSKTYVLVENSLPPQPTYYIPRYLSNRIIIEKSVFAKPCPDIFVFKGVERHELSKLAHPHNTASSSSQLEEITSRYIHLDSNDDWLDLRKASTVPCHLIKFVAENDSFILEDTTKPSEILKKICVDRARIYFTEDEFVENQIAKNAFLSGACFCDVPGMGKTFLLGNLSRKFSKIFDGRIVAFIVYSKFLRNVTISKTEIGPLEALFYVMKYMSTAVDKALLLAGLLLNNSITLDLFFDGFDEIQLEERYDRKLKRVVGNKKLEWTKKLFRDLRRNFSNIRIYVTSRLHMRKELETSLGVIAYDMLPFSEVNQVEFLTAFWISKGPLHCDRNSFCIFASKCLKLLNSTLTSYDQDITGIPLQCQLIAEIYYNKAVLFSAEQDADIPLASRSVCDMFKAFYELRVNEGLSVYRDKGYFSEIQTDIGFKKSINLFHLSRALKLIHPDIELPSLLNLSNVENCDLSLIYKIGIIKNCSHDSLLAEFVHRTFAEYIVADSCALFLSSPSEWDDTCDAWFELLFKVVFKYRDDDYEKKTIAYFINSILPTHVGLISTYDTSVVFVKYILINKLHEILGGLCQKNFINIFRVFKNMFIHTCGFHEFRIFACFYQTIDNILEILTLAIRHSGFSLFHECLQLANQVSMHTTDELCNANLSNSTKDTLLQLAVTCDKYDIVEYLVNICTLTGQNIIERCVSNSYNKSRKVLREKMSILQLLLNKDKTLIKENENILITSEVNLKLIKILTQFGANLNANTDDGLNCAMYATQYMSPSDYHDFMKFLLEDCKAHNLLKSSSKWKDPLYYICSNCLILPDTLEIIKNIPGLKSILKNDKILLALEANSIFNLNFFE